MRQKWFQIWLSHKGGSGNGSNLRLRGIGSSSISAAFDHSIAINIDGVVVNRGRFIHNAYFDMNQIEVLKGPQSLYLVNQQLQVLSRLQQMIHQMNLNLNLEQALKRNMRELLLI